MIKQLCNIRDVILRVRLQLRFGRLSRAPLRLLRLEWSGDHVDCDWLARPRDEWDRPLSPQIGESNESLQALEDAIVVRDLVFSSLREISSARLRVFREEPDGAHELIIVGTVTRSERFLYKVNSLAMRAKLCGFHFYLNDSKLMSFQIDGSLPF
jgi:hypothetical protein